ncbi:MAG: M15 family metallopeptidase, partial [Treponema sp.]|nr:M15 family metallopeptidase [Treponema sp.]
MNRAIIVLTIYIILFGNIYSCRSKQIIPEPEPVPVIEKDNYPFAEPEEPTRAEQVMKAIYEAYKDQFDGIEFRNDDWAVLLRDRWYYFAGGRLLPEEELENILHYRTYQFYNYPAELPEWERPSEEQVERFRNWSNNRSTNTIQRASFFLDALYQASTRTETENRLVRITFLGKPTRVHYLIKDKVAFIEEQIYAAAETNPLVSAWVNSINTLEGYGWRNIADSQSRSFHSYGIALDLLPNNLGRRQTYWLWTTRHREDWWNVSYNERYHPPDFVIKTFESQGFIWGGKWQLFDTMHFEY